MRIGILGSGLMGGKLGTIFARAGHEVVFSYARSEGKLGRLARDAQGKASVGTPREAARNAEAVLLAVHWSRMDDVLKQAGDLSGKVVVTCSLPMNGDDTALVIAHSSSGAEKLAARLPEARVVSAFNTVPSEVLFGVFEARGQARKPSLVYCGDESSSKAAAARLIRDAGFDAVDAGHCASRVIPSPSRCSSPNWRTREKEVRSWRTGSSGWRLRSIEIKLVVGLRGASSTNSRRSSRLAHGVQVARTNGRRFASRWNAGRETLARRLPYDRSPHPPPRRDLRPSAFPSIYLLGLIPGLLAAQDTAGPPVATPNSRPTAASFTVVRAPGPIEIDGTMDDAGWEGAPKIPVDNEVAPGDNVPGPVKAVCLLTFDSDNLYMGCRAFDPNPDQIRAHVVDRDNVGRLAQDDLIGAYIDPFNDQRRAFAFIVNPHGVQAEGVRHLGRQGEDFSWDAIWESSARITSEGWEVEMAIPFKSLRFPRTSGVQTWGFTLLRAWPRNNRVRMTSARLERGNTCDLCQANRISGFQGISPGRNVQITPTLTGGRTDARQDFPTGPLAKGDVDGDVGVDLLVGLTPNVSLNATVNPDFSQVEADVAQLDVNQRFALSYPEKRPFFMEGADFFGSPIQAVFTRTIADPLVGAKISGKIGASTRNTIGLFSVRDRVTLLQFPSNQFTTATSLEQEAWTAAARFRRDLGEASSMGLLYTGRAGTGYANQVAGVDFFYRLGPSTRLGGQYLASVTEYPDVVATGFGQPHGSFTGGAARIELNHDTRRWRVAASYLDLSPEFRADMGFVPRVDVRTVQAEVAPVWYRGSGWFTQLDVGPFVSRTEDHGGVLTDQDIGITASYQGPWQSFARVEVYDRQERFQGLTHRFPRVNGFLDVKPREGLQFTFQWQFGGGIDYANGREARESIMVPSVYLGLGKGLTVDLSNAFQRLSDQGRKILTANILQSKIAYNFSIKTMVRAIVQYREVRRNQAQFSGPIEPKVGDILGQFLFSHKVNPQTVLFLGYSDTGITTRSYDLTRVQRTFFAKIGYAWRP